VAERKVSHFRINPPIRGSIVGKYKMESDKDSVSIPL